MTNDPELDIPAHVLRRLTATRDGFHRSYGDTRPASVIADEQAARCLALGLQRRPLRVGAAAKAKWRA